jgi:hypothetical protein
VLGSPAAQRPLVRVGALRGAARVASSVAPGGSASGKEGFGDGDLEALEYAKAPDNVLGYRGSNPTLSTPSLNLPAGDEALPSLKEAIAFYCDCEVYRQDPEEHMDHIRDFLDAVELCRVSCMGVF